MHREKREGYTLVEVPAEISDFLLQIKRHSIVAELDSDEIKIVLNMEKVAALYSTDIGALIGIYKDLKAAEKQLFLANVSDKIESIMVMVNLEQLIPMFSTLEEFEINYDLECDQDDETDEFNMQLIPGNQFTTVELHGSIIANESIDSLRSLLAKLNDMEPIVIFDLQEFDMVDTIGTELITDFAQNLKNKGGVLIFAHANEILIDLFCLLSMDETLKTFDTLEQAHEYVESLQNSQEE